MAAHALLASVRAVLSTLATLRRTWDRLDDDARDELLAVAESHAVHVDGVLHDLIAGMPGEAPRALESLPRDDGVRRAPGGAPVNPWG